MLQKQHSSSLETLPIYRTLTVSDAEELVLVPLDWTTVMHC